MERDYGMEIDALIKGQAEIRQLLTQHINAEKTPENERARTAEKEENEYRSLEFEVFSELNRDLKNSSDIALMGYIRS